MQAWCSHLALRALRPAGGVTTALRSLSGFPRPSKAAWPRGTAHLRPVSAFDSLWEKRGLSTAAPQDPYPFTHKGADSWFTLCELQKYACTTFPDRKVFGSVSPSTGDYEWITYGEFQGMTLRLRAALRASGLKKGEKMAIISNNRLEWAVMAYACYGLGVPVVPLYESQSAADWEYIIKDSQASYLSISNHKTWARIHEETSLIAHLESNTGEQPSGSVRNYILFEAEESDAHSYKAWMNEGTALMANNPECESLQGGCDAVTKDDLCTLIYTSGTTGSPKGVMLSHNNICTNIKAIREVAAERLNEETVSLTFLPWAHVYGQTMELHQLISAGAATGIAQSAHTLLDDIKKVKPNLLVAVPVVYHRVFDGVKAKIMNDPSQKLKAKLFQAALKVAAERREWFDEGKTGLDPWLWLRWRLVERFVFSGVKAVLGGNLKYGFTGGATLSPLVQQWFSDIGIPIIEGYGLTETSPVIASERFGPTESTQGGLRAVPGVKMMICRFDVDASGDNAIPVELGPDEEGEICTSGPNVMMGYYNKPEATANVLFKAPNTGETAFRTGDLGRISKDGVLKITGRANEQYKLINGKFVVPSHIEDPYRLWSQNIFQAFVYGRDRPNTVMLVVPNFTSVAQALELQGDAASVEAIVSNPKALALIEHDVRQISGKIDTQYAVPKAVRLVAEPFTVENGLLTPKLSMKRKAIQAKYEALLASMYEK